MFVMGSDVVLVLLLYISLLTIAVILFMHFLCCFEVNFVYLVRVLTPGTNHKTYHG